jgi:predicted nucleic acid-binding protein
MNDKYFIDTNIFVYCFDDREPDKKTKALNLIADALQTGNGVISTQVMQEFLNVAIRKFSVPLNTDDTKIYLQKVLNPLCQVFPDLGLYIEALNISEKTGYSFYDSLILASALASGCSILYSEDFQNGQQIENLKIIDPFA